MKTANYQTLLNYWNNGGTAPSVSFAFDALMQMAENAKIQNCIYRKDVIDAMFRQVKDSTTIPFSIQSIPGVVNASDFDLGRHGRAYMDIDNADYHVSSGTYTAWNSGYTYRNDGADIGSSFDAEVSSTINYIGWTADNEWLQYTVNVDTTAAYTVKFRYAATDDESKIRLLLNDADITGALSLPSTGGYQSWRTLTINEVILYKGQQKIKVLFEKGGANLGYIRFILEKKTEDIALKPTLAETYHDSQLIYLSFNKMLVDSTVAIDRFSCTVNGNVVIIKSLTINEANPAQIIISLDEQIFDIDDIKLNYADGSVIAADGTKLQNFSNMQVKNNLPVNITIPGKIEAEAFSVNQGLALENTADAGGGQNIGYTNPGDYLDYKVRVLKTSKYMLEVRVASLATAGKIEVQQLNSNGAISNTVTLNIPVTGGWQVWQTISTTMELTEGVCVLRVKILQPEFNINWFRFTESSFGIQEDKNPGFSMFPNPAIDVVSILIPGSTGQRKTITLLSSGGTVVKKIELAGSEVSKKLFTGDLPKGFYIVEMQMSGKISRNKLILQ